MAQNVVINGVTYNEVKKVEIPLASDPSQSIDYLNTDDATAVAASVKKGETFYAGGEQRTGAMPVNEAIDKTLDAADNSVSIPAGYNPGGTVKVVPETKAVTPTKEEQTVKASSGKVMSQVTIGKIPDAYQDVSGVDAAAADVKKGKKIVDANGQTVTGTHTDPSFTLANGVLSIK